MIADDEPLGIAVLETYLQNDPYFSVKASFTDPEEALAYLNQHPIDVLLLDVNMPLLDGFQLLNKVKRSILTILTTAHKKYLQEGFDYGVLDYLQKPIKKERLLQALARAQKELLQQKLLQAISPSTKSQLYIKSAQKEFYIEKENVLFIKGLKDYCTLYLSSQEKITVLGSLKTFLIHNNTDNWLVRVHKSYAVPIQQITGIQNTSIVSIKETSIPIGRKYRTAFLNQFRNNGL